MAKGKSAQLLLGYLDRNACIRLRSTLRHEKEGARAYKKGYEVRFPVRSGPELHELILAFRQLNLHPGKPYAKGKQIIVPIYGKEQVLRILELMDELRG